MDLIERAAQISGKKLSKKDAKGKKKPQADTATAKKPFKAIGGKKGITQETKLKPIKSLVRPIVKSPRADPTSMGGISKPEVKKARADPTSMGGISKPEAKKARPHKYLSDALESAVEADKLRKVNAKPDGIRTGASGSKLFGSKANKKTEPDHSTEEKTLAPKKTKTAARSQAGPGSPNYAELDFTILREGGYIMPDMPPNMMAEEFRIIKRSILLNAFSDKKDAPKHSNVLMVTSSNPNEGKTYCAINLALSVATEQDTTVLLIDSDFSKPEILNRIGARGGKGVMDILADPAIDVRDCLIRTSIPNLVVLPAGRQSNRTTELLASERMNALVHEISTRYPDRLVIFDAPPVLASSIPSVLSLNVGQTVFVIEAENTTEPMIKESLTMIKACPNIGLLLNKTRAGSSNKKFATYYGYGGS